MNFEKKCNEKLELYLKKFASKAHLKGHASRFAWCKDKVSPIEMDCHLVTIATHSIACRQLTSQK